MKVRCCTGGVRVEPSGALSRPPRYRYGMDGSVKVPLGIHIVAPTDEKTSVFLSLECYFVEARLMGMQFEFEEEEADD